VSYDEKSNSVIFSGPNDDVHTAEQRFSEKCLHALRHDSVVVSQPGMIHRSCGTFLRDFPGGGRGRRTSLVHD